MSWNVCKLFYYHSIQVCYSLCIKADGAVAYCFIAVGDMQVGCPLKHILLWVPLGGCHRVLHTKAILS